MRLSFHFPSSGQVARIIDLLETAGLTIRTLRTTRSAICAEVEAPGSVQADALAESLAANLQVPAVSYWAHTANGGYGNTRRF